MSACIGCARPRLPFPGLEKDFKSFFVVVVQISLVDFHHVINSKKKNPYHGLQDFEWFSFWPLLWFHLPPPSSGPDTAASSLVFGTSSIFLSSHLCSLNGMLFVQTVVSFSPAQKSLLTVSCSSSLILVICFLLLFLSLLDISHYCLLF